MIEQLKTIREALLDARSLLHDGRRQDKALTALAQLEQAVGSVEPMFWVRLCSDGMYEGPIHNAQIERVRAQSGAWSPLFLGAAPVAQQPQAEAVPVAVVKYQVGGLVVHIVGDVQEGDELFKTPQQAEAVPSDVVRDAERLDWLLMQVSGKEFRRIGVEYSGNCQRADIDAAIAAQGASHE